MITCDRCKTENLEGSQYCDECGAPLRPNGHGLLSPKNYPNGGNGQNGSRTNLAGAHQEFATGHVSGNLNLASIPQATKPHARLVIEKGRSTGKQFMLSDLESQIGRWDADGGIFPDVDLDSDDDTAVSPAAPGRLDTYSLSRQVTGSVAVIQSTGDGYLPAKQARLAFGADSVSRRFFEVGANNHRFSGGEGSFRRVVVEALNWISTNEGAHQ